MKKIIKLSICIMVFVACGIISAYAYNVGDVIGNTVYTDIVASINYYNIASFNINGNTVIVAEDLRNYGFDVKWSPEERALYIKRSGSNKIPSTYIAPAVSQELIGKKAQNVVYSDIKTYINGALVTSYNIGGNTMVNFNDLSPFGQISYNNYIRRLDLKINDGLDYKISPPIKPNEFYVAGLYFLKNSVNGLQIRWFANVNTNKTINYYTTTYYMYNSVGDLAYDRWGKNSFVIKVVGPVQSGEMLLNFTGEHEAEVYDAPVNRVQLYSIFLEYADGTSETIYYGYEGTKKSKDFDFDSIFN